MKVLAAVDDDRLPGDELGTRPAEKDDRADDVLGLLVALQCARGDGDVAKRFDHLRIFANTVRHREPRRDAVDEDVVGAVVFLCGPGATFVTGQTIVIDGGQYFH